MVALAPGGLGLTCPRCGQDYPVVDGVPLVLADLDGWLRQEGAAVLLRRDLPPLLLARLAAGTEGVVWRDLERLAAWTGPPSPERDAWRRSCRALTDGPAVELGCGPLADDGRVVGLDLHWASLRARGGPCVLADALEPPWAPESCALVIADSLLDSCRDPSLLLHRARELLRPGGWLCLSSPFCWRPEITPRTSWLLPEAVEDWLAGQGELRRTELRYTLALGPRSRAEHHAVAWQLRLSH